MKQQQVTEQVGQAAQRSTWQLYKRLLVYARPYWLAFVVSFIGFALYGASPGLVGPVD